MSTRNKILLSLAGLALFSMLLFIVFGEYGLADFNLLRQERDRLLQRNAQLDEENRALYRQIERLKTDLDYIESVARQELGMIGKDEVIIQLKKHAGGKKQDE